MKSVFFVITALFVSAFLLSCNCDPLETEEGTNDASEVATQEKELSPEEKRREEATIERSPEKEILAEKEAETSKEVSESLAEKITPEESFPKTEPESEIHKEDGGSSETIPEETRLEDSDPDENIPEERVMELEKTREDERMSTEEVFFEAETTREKEAVPEENYPEPTPEEPLGEIIIDYSSTPDTPMKCTSNSDCRTHSGFCGNDGLCFYENSPCQRCPQNTWCNSEGQCIYGPPLHKCSSRKDCPGRIGCVANSCSPCFTNSHCDTHEVCHSGDCGLPSLKCQQDTDCGLGKCTQGVCYRVSQYGKAGCDIEVNLMQMMVFVMAKTYKSTTIIFIDPATKKVEVGIDTSGYGGDTIPPHMRCFKLYDDTTSSWIDPKACELTRNMIVQDNKFGTILCWTI
ncbi:hypothetical protein KKC60_01760 [Patescibacteria group bacterium]|nr:hypothetical protein [Patescibacteria group bacterium]